MGNGSECWKSADDKILGYLCDGLSCEDIAKKLNLGVDVVERRAEVYDAANVPEKADPIAAMVELEGACAEPNGLSAEGWPGSGTERN